MTSIDGPLPDSDHLRQDINIPEEATLGDPGTSSPAGTTSSLNAGQQVGGLGSVGEYAAKGQGSAEQDAARPSAEES